MKISFDICTIIVFDKLEVFDMYRCDFLFITLLREDYNELKIVRTTLTYFCFAAT